jgi:hypothetical protein
MEKQIIKTNDKQAKPNDKKQSYDPPRLKKIGTVRDLTLGSGIQSWDDGAMYRS